MSRKTFQILRVVSHETYRDTIEANNTAIKTLKYSYKAEKKLQTVIVKETGSTLTEIRDIYLSIVSPYLLYSALIKRVDKKSDRFVYFDVKIVGKEKLELIYNISEHKKFLFMELGLSPDNPIQPNDLLEKYIQNSEFCIYRRMLLLNEILTATNNYFFASPLFDLDFIKPAIEEIKKNKFCVFFPYFCEQMRIAAESDVYVLKQIFDLCATSKDFFYYYARVLILTLGKYKRSCFVEQRYLKKSWEKEAGKNIGNVDSSKFPAILEKLVLMNEIVIKDGKFVYLKSVYEKQLEIVRKLAKIQLAPNIYENANETIFKATITKYNLREKQVEALYSLLSNKMSLIDGLPGTGKTEILTSAIYYLTQLNPDIQIMCTSFVGLMVDTLKKRVLEKCGELPNVNIQTIHMNYTRMKFSNPDMFKNIKVVFIDEAGYMNLEVFNMLMETYNDLDLICFFGGSEQIRGNDYSIFDDIAAIAGDGYFRLGTKLEDNFRSKDRPNLVHNTHMLLEKSPCLKSCLKYVTFKDAIPKKDHGDTMIGLTMSSDGHNYYTELLSGIEKTVEYMVESAKAQPEDIQFFSFKNTDIDELNGMIFKKYFDNDRVANIFYGGKLYKQMLECKGDGWKKLLRCVPEGDYGNLDAKEMQLDYLKVGQKIMLTENKRAGDIKGIISDTCANGEIGFIIGLYNVFPDFRFSECYQVMIIHTGKQFIIHKRFVKQCKIRSAWVISLDKGQGQQCLHAGIVFTPALMNGKLLSSRTWSMCRRAIVGATRPRLLLSILGVEVYEPVTGRKRREQEKVDKKLIDVFDQLQLIINQQEMDFKSRMNELFLEQLSVLKK